MVLTVGYTWGAEFYVRPYTPGGYGPSTGSSWGAAFNGFDRVKWGGDSVTAGDSLFVCGDHTNEYFNVGASGTSDQARIVIDGACPHDPGIIHPGNQSAGIRIDGRSYITIRNLVIESGKGAGMGIGSSPNRHLVIANVTARGNKRGIDVMSEHLVLRDSDIHGNLLAGAQVARSPHATVRNCRFFENGREGNHNHDGLFIGNGSFGFLVEDSQAYNNRSLDGSGFDSSASEDGEANGTYRRCRAFGNEGRGFSASGGRNSMIRWEFCLSYENRYGFFIYEYVTFMILNCTVGDASGGAIVANPRSGHRVGTIKNTIVSGTSPYGLVVNSKYVDLTCDHNDFTSAEKALIYDLDQTRHHTLSEWQARGHDEHSLSLDPRFVDAAQGDFRLVRSSPVAAKGAPTLWEGFPSVLDAYRAPVTDTEGRLVVGSVHIGCAGVLR